MKLTRVWFSYTGRLKPFDLWLKGILPGILLGVVAMRLDAELEAWGMIMFPFLLFSLWPGSALLVKRWHDRNRSGWFCFTVFAPIVGQIWTLIEAGFLRGSVGQNRFGPDPCR
jgi:uncharacterized membrane protein YhaH (DUF805 family)